VDLSPIEEKAYSSEYNTIKEIIKETNVIYFVFLFLENIHRSKSNRVSNAEALGKEITDTK
jgi:hypothetical protein